MKRPLDKQEREISEKSLKRMKEELEYNIYQFDICELKLNRGIMIDYLKQVRDYSKLKKDFKDEIRILDGNIGVINEQLEKGVEIKEITEIDKKQEKGEIKNG